MNRALLIGACAIGALSIAGCGSGGGALGHGGGVAAMTIRWPASVAGVIPRNTQSVRVTLYKASGQTDEQPEVIAGPKLVVRPQNPSPGPATVVFDDLPPGPVRAEVTAYGTRDGSDAACSRGFGQGTIEPGQRTQIRVDMSSTTSRVDVQPTSFQLAPGGTHTFAAKAFDFSNNPLLGIAFVWRSNDPSIAQVDPFTGVVTANGAGQTEIIAQEEFGTLEARATVFVQ